MSNSNTLGDLTEVADRVWAYVQPDGTWWVNNTGAIEGDDGLLIVDTCATDRRTSAFLDAVGDVSTKAARWAMNTHTHGDHTYGNSLLPVETCLLGHAAMREFLANDPVFDECPPLWDPVPQWGDVVRRVPSVTYADAVTVHVGGFTVELRHPGYAAHTTGDSIAWVPDRRVLFSGDLLFNGLTPLVMMGSVDGALRSLDWMADLHPVTVVPGHGPIIEQGELSRVLGEHDRYYSFLIETARRGLDQGLTPLQLATDLDLGEFADWADSERLVANLHRAYADHRGGDVDPVVALSDAVTWAGGPMHTSV